MKIYVHEKGVMLSGKAWEIVQKLKQYERDFRLVSDWIENNQKNVSTSPHWKPILRYDRK